MYVSGYIKKTLIEGLNIFNKEGYGGTSALLINNGDNTFTDKTKESGLYYKAQHLSGGLLRCRRRWARRLDRGS